MTCMKSARGRTLTFNQNRGGSDRQQTAGCEVLGDSGKDAYYDWMETLHHGEFRPCISRGLVYKRYILLVYKGLAARTLRDN